MALELKTLADWLQQHAPENVLMPLRLGSKEPTRRHKDGQWNWDAFRRAPVSADYGILMRTLICFDFDPPPLFDHIKAENPDWFVPGTYAKAATAKGFHLIWRRSDFCDDLSLTDKARSLDPTRFPSHLLDQNGEVPLDLKTITSTGTSGVLVVAPSKNKSWVTPPWDLPHGPAAVPDGLLQWWCDHQKPRTRDYLARVQHQGTPCTPRVEGQWTVDIDPARALALAKQCLETGSDGQPGYMRLQPDHDCLFYQRDDNELYFRTGPHRKCPYRDEPHDSNNFKLHFCANGDIRYFCFGCQARYAELRDAGELLPIGRWYDMQNFLNFEDASFDMLACGRLPGEWDRLVAAKPDDRDEQRIAELEDCIIQYMNRFFIVVTAGKPSILEVRYNQWDMVNYFDRRTIRDTLQLYPSRFFSHVWY